VIPQLPETSPVDVAEAAPVLNALSMPEGELLSLNLHRDGARFFRARGNGRDLFIRIENADVAGHMCRTEEITRWLRGRGLHVNACLDDFPVSFDGDFIFAYPFVQGRYLRPDADDIRDLGQAVRALHDALDQHPKRCDIEDETDRWLAMISGMRARIVAGHDAGPRPADLRAIAAMDDIDFVMAGLPRRICHGDLNAGNVMRDTVSGDIILFDFEDVTHSALPPVMEIVRMVERMILVHQPAGAVPAGQALIAAYTGGGPVDGDLYMALRAHAVRSLCLLAVMEDSGTTLPESEWHKFFTLFDAAEPLKDVLRAMNRFQA